MYLTVYTTKALFQCFFILCVWRFSRCWVIRPPLLFSFPQPVLLSSGQTPLYTSAVSTLVRTQTRRCPWCPGGQTTPIVYKIILLSSTLHNLDNLQSRQLFCHLHPVHRVPLSKNNQTIYDTSLLKFCVYRATVTKGRSLNKIQLWDQSLEWCCPMTLSSSVTSSHIAMWHHYSHGLFSHASASSFWC